MEYPLDGQVPFVEPIEEIDSGQVMEIIEGKEEVTAKIEITPDIAQRIEEATRGAIVHTLGAGFDALLIFDIDREMATQVMNKTIEILKVRKICDFG